MNCHLVHFISSAGDTSNNSGGLRQHRTIWITIAAISNTAGPSTQSPGGGLCQHPTHRVFIIFSLTKFNPHNNPIIDRSPVRSFHRPKHLNNRPNQTTKLIFAASREPSMTKREGSICNRCTRISLSVTTINCRGHQDLQILCNNQPRGIRDHMLAWHVTNFQERRMGHHYRGVNTLGCLLSLL
jgi:hypothetical protein